MFLSESLHFGPSDCFGVGGFLTPKNTYLQMIFLLI